MNDAEAQPTPVVAPLLGPRLPADHGLGSLGLIMQLAGSVFMGLMGVMAFTIVATTTGGTEGLWASFLVTTTGAVRSSFHRSAGTQLLYGATAPMRGVKVYVIAALLQSVIALFLMSSKLHFHGVLLLYSAILLLAWPLTLAVILSLPRFRRYQHELPLPEDKGFEGASVLMVVFGTLGVMLVGLFILLMLFNLPRALSAGAGIATLLMMVALVIRSALHLVAGQKGVTGASVDRTVEATNTYINFAFAASFIAGGISFLALLSAMSMAAMMAIAIFVFLLLAWPLALRRFFSERQFAELLAGDDAPVHRRAPDAGLTALGWLLLPLAVIGLSSSLLEALAGSSDMGRLVAGSSLFSAGGALTAALGRSPWWAVGIAGLQLFAAIELIRMSDRYRLAATLYGVVAAVVTIYLYLPLLDGIPHLLHYGGGRGLGGPSQALGYAPIAFALALPVITMLLANRNIAPMARARFAPRAAAPNASTAAAAPVAVPIPANADSAVAPVEPTGANGIS